eukprot:6253594-Pyramimonas_sp.AAC.1
MAPLTNSPCAAVPMSNWNVMNVMSDYLSDSGSTSRSSFWSSRKRTILRALAPPPRGEQKDEAESEPNREA